METEFREESLSIAQKVKAHAEKKGMSAGHFAFNWVLANKIVTSVIAGPRTLEQWNDYVAALGNRESDGDSGTSSRVFAMIASQMGDTKYRGRILWMLLTARPDLLPIDLKRQGRAEVRAVEESLRAREGEQRRLLADNERLGALLREGSGQLWAAIRQAAPALQMLRRRAADVHKEMGDAEFYELVRRLSGWVLALLREHDGLDLNADKADQLREDLDVTAAQRKKLDELRKRLPG